MIEGLEDEDDKNLPDEEIDSKVDIKDEYKEDSSGSGNNSNNNNNVDDLNNNPSKDDNNNSKDIPSINDKQWKFLSYQWE